MCVCVDGLLEIISIDSAENMRRIPRKGTVILSSVTTPRLNIAEPNNTAKLPFLYKHNTQTLGIILRFFSAHR